MRWAALASSSSGVIGGQWSRILSAISSNFAINVSRGSRIWPDAIRLSPSARSTRNHRRRWSAVIGHRSRAVCTTPQPRQDYPHCHLALTALGSACGSPLLTIWPHGVAGFCDRRKFALVGRVDDKNPIVSITFFFPHHVERRAGQDARGKIGGFAQYNARSLQTLYGNARPGTPFFPLTADLGFWVEHRRCHRLLTFVEVAADHVLVEDQRAGRPRPWAGPFPSEDADRRPSSGRAAATSPALKRSDSQSGLSPTTM